MAVPISKEEFGKTSKGEEIYKFTFSNENNVTISVLNFGCVIYEIKVPDKEGKVADINLGFDNVKDYEINNTYFGALCGRVANRIGKAQFTMNGTTFKCSQNDSLGHFLHGGFVGFSRSVWSWSIEDNQLILSLTDPDGSEGLPGEVVTHVTLSLDNDNVFTMDYKATTTKPTPIDMGSHFMMNLAGHDAGLIEDHSLMIKSDYFIKMGTDFLPTGELVHVGTTGVDFRQRRSFVGRTMERIPGGIGLHHGFCIGEISHASEHRGSGDEGKKKLVGRVEHRASGRYMEVSSTNPAVFVYSNHFVEKILGEQKCKGGAVYKQYGAIELMPMGYPNAVNMRKFPSPIVKPGKTYHQTAWYTFGVLK